MKLVSFERAGRNGNGTTDGQTLFPTATVLWSATRIGNPCSSQRRWTLWCDQRRAPSDF